MDLNSKRICLGYTLFGQYILSASIDSREKLDPIRILYGKKNY